MTALIQAVIFGISAGATFALLAAGIVLVYRASGVLNFAHASVAMAAAFVNFEVLERWPGITVGGAAAVAVATGVVLGLVSRAVFTTVVSASAVVKLLVSFGLAGVIQGAVGLVFSRLGTPSMTGRSLLSVRDGPVLAGVGVPWQRVAVIVAATGLTAALAVTVRRTAWGIRLRALAQNRAAARLAGVDDRRVETVTWSVAGATAAVAGVLQAPFGVLNVLSFSGFQIKALAAALVGGFVSLPAALAGGLGLGVATEVTAAAPAPVSGLSAAVAPALILVLVGLRVERWFVSEQEAAAVEGDARTFGGLRRPPVGRPAAWWAAAAAAGAATLALSGFWTFVATRTVIMAVLALSVVVLTGWNGQVSLMPGTFAGVGACLAWILDTRLGFDFWLVVPLAALGTIPVCAVVGVVALRLRPLYLAVATLALAGLFEETLFRAGWFANGGAELTVRRPGLLAGDHAYAAAVLGWAGLLFALTAGVAHRRTGRAWRMVRDNDRAAAAVGVNPARWRLVAFAVSAAWAGVAGALLAYLVGTFSTDLFAFSVLSLTAFGLATVGGIRSPVGALVGAFAYVYLTELFRGSGPVSDVATAAVGAGIVAVLAVSPDGLAGLWVGLGERLRELRSGPQSPGAPPGDTPPVDALPVGAPPVDALVVGTVPVDTVPVDAGAADAGRSDTGRAEAGPAGTVPPGTPEEAGGRSAGTAPSPGPATGRGGGG